MLPTAREKGETSPSSLVPFFQGEEDQGVKFVTGGTQERPVLITEVTWQDAYPLAPVESGDGIFFAHTYREEGGVACS